MIVTLALMAAGLILLVAGAEVLVRGASRLALALGIPPVVIGLTVVAYGTSCPELAVSLLASWSGQNDIAIGNVLGSNIFNVLLILGVSALIIPLTVHRQIIRLDVPVMIAVAGVLAALSWNGRVGRVEGVALLIAGAAYTAWLIRLARKGQEGGEADDENPESTPGARRRWWIDLGLVVAGVGLLVAGSRWLVDGAVAIARIAGVSELVIGLTIIAGGTSLPEVATSVLAALRGQRDIAVGNVIGSNIFNVLFVLGGAAALSPAGIGVPLQARLFDLPVVLAVSVACLPIFFSGRRIDRWEGGLFLGWYAAYTVMAILMARGHHLADELILALVVFALPLTLLTIGIIVWRERGRGAMDQTE